MYAVFAPQHSFLRLIRKEAPPHNIEVTSGGGVLTDDEYARKFGISRRGIESGAYLRTLTLKEYLGVFLMQNALVHYPRGEYGQALAYFETANELDPRDPVYLKYLASCWKNAAKTAFESGLPELAAKHFEKSLAFGRRADELGFSRGPNQAGR